MNAEELGEVIYLYSKSYLGTHTKYPELKVPEKLILMEWKHYFAGLSAGLLIANFNVDDVQAAEAIVIKRIQAEKLYV